MAGIDVSPPLYPGGPGTPIDAQVIVIVAHDGITIMATSEATEPESAEARAASPAKVARTGDGDGDYDFAALTEIAREIKATFPWKSMVVIDAEGDVHLQTLIHTMDALRGPDCSMTREDYAGCLLPFPVLRVTSPLFFSAEPVAPLKRADF